jgi:hypothetical protein
MSHHLKVKLGFDALLLSLLLLGCFIGTLLLEAEQIIPFAMVYSVIIAVCSLASSLVIVFKTTTYWVERFFTPAIFSMACTALFLPSIVFLPLGILSAEPHIVPVGIKTVYCGTALLFLAFCIFMIHFMVNNYYQNKESKQAEKSD